MSNRVDTILSHLNPTMNECSSSSYPSSNRVNVETLRKWMDGPYHAEKDVVRKFVRENELFHNKFQDFRGIEEERQLAYERMSAYYAQQWVSVDEIERNVELCLAIGEPINWVDPSAATKSGAQAFLYAGCIALLGDDGQKKQYLQRAAELKDIGGFAMTEKGHGSNVRSIETTAIYDPLTDEIIINSPTDSAEKWYIGNAMSANMSAVFAQLIVNGENHGPHAVVVPLRDVETGMVLDGVTLTDNMTKGGLNGVDNGRIKFDNVRVPRTNLLSRFGAIDANGNYSSPIKNTNKRFFDILSALTPTRCAVILSALANMKVTLNVALRYAHKRRQFSPNPKQGVPEYNLIQFTTHQTRLLPDLATLIGLITSLRTKIAGWQTRSMDTERAVLANVSGLKAYATWTAVDCIQRCRECCGGQGYLLVNNIAGRRRDADIFCTYEGDNTVLLQVVAKYMLDQFQRDLKKNGVFGTVAFITGSIHDRLGK